MKNELVYFTCTIGPIYRNLVPDGGDFPMRQAVKKAYLDLIGENASMCSSGWGTTTEFSKLIQKLDLMRFINHPDYERIKSEIMQCDK
jgi:hypothetical protein